MSKKWELYEAKDKIIRKNKHCPKCGEGVFLAKHKDRLNCGKCGYTEFTSKKPQGGVEGKPEKQKEEKAGDKPAQ